MGIESFISAQRVALIETISKEAGKESKASEALNSFLDVLQSKMAGLTRQIKARKVSPVKSPGKKKSPTKSPSKKENESVDDKNSYGSPEGKCKRLGMSFYSPGKNDDQN